MRQKKAADGCDKLKNKQSLKNDQENYMTSRELAARHKKNSHDRGERVMIKSKQNCFMTGFGVWFLNGKEEEQKIAKREEREEE